MISLSLDMPSILNTPANEIPIYFFHLPVTQREVLLVNVLTDPTLYESIVASPHFHDDPTFQQAIVLFQNYTLIRQLFARLAVPHLPIQIAKAFGPTLAATRTSILVLLVDWELNRLLGTLPRDHLTLILRTIILSLSEGQWQAYYHPDDPVEVTVQEEEEDHGPPLPHVKLRSPRPTRASSPTDSLSSTDTPVNPLPQLARHTNPFPPHQSNPLSPREHYRRDTTPAQRGRPRVDRRGTPAVGSGRVTLPRGLEVVVGASTSTNPIDIPNSTPPTPTMVQCFQCRSTDHVCPQCPEYICPFCRLATPGHPQQTCHMRSCPICGELGHVGTSCPTTTTVHPPTP